MGDMTLRCVLAGVCLCATTAMSQTAYFADGFHGGFYGHYPTNFTQFMVESMRKNPDWKLNLEIEPATWDFAGTNTPEDLAAFKALAADQSVNGRVEFVNPAYGQSYLWNISGESVIQQLDRGMKKIREYFPNADFSTYSSEEPCFTSALPGILRSFGFRHAVLKNPNTCWGGYTRAYGKELVNWVGPDGTAIRTVPRYEIESLKSNSTWETIAAANGSNYITAALKDGIEHPVGMCLQDAGWRWGPWLSHGKSAYRPTESVTWREYFDKIATNAPAPDWAFDQEDVRVSLVWGSQILQHVAQDVRQAENWIVMAEKTATISGALRNAPWPTADMDEAWRTLLLSQHHDCWIVPYNRRFDRTWADNVALWTESAQHTSLNIVVDSIKRFHKDARTNGSPMITVLNTTAHARAGCVAADLPSGWSSAKVLDSNFHEAISQLIVEKSKTNILFRAQAPSLGFSTYQLQKSGHSTPSQGITAAIDPSGMARMESDLYSILIDSKRGGAIVKLIAKKLGGKNLIADDEGAGLNELRGFFPRQEQFCSTTNAPAEIQILENGQLETCVKISGQIAGNRVDQWITLREGDPRIDFKTRIDWKGEQEIGANPTPGGFRANDDHKAFYDDRFKLRVLFPFALKNEKIFKDAPFAVTESHLTNTYFDRWSEIKNNVILHWVDACDASAGIGVALLTDQTTSYSSAPGEPLGLTAQFSGDALWGRSYSLSGPTEFRYALLLHAGDWQQARLWTAADEWNEPLLALTDHYETGEQSLLSIDGDALEVPTMRVVDGKVVVRLFNPSREAVAATLHYSGKLQSAEMVQLNGEPIRSLTVQKDSQGHALFTANLPKFGIGTIRITP